MNSEDETLLQHERPVVWANGKWRIGGLMTYFYQQHEWLRQRIPTLPTQLPPHCLDPVQIARFLGENLDDFDWKGPDLSQVLAAIQRAEEKLGTGTIRKSVSDTAAQMLTTKEVSILLGCSYSEAREKMLDGRIRSVKDGRWLRSRKEWVEEYLLKQVVKKPDQEPGEVRAKRPKAKLVGEFKKGGLAYEFLRSRPD
jgi:excisionase family DNA binding protein